MLKKKISSIQMSCSSLRKNMIFQTSEKSEIDVFPALTELFLWGVTSSWWNYDTEVYDLLM